MGTKIAAFVVTLMVNLIIGAVTLFMMLVAMNGYSESDAQWGLLAYIVLAAVTSLLMAVGAVLLAGKLLKRQFSPIAAILISVPLFSIAGIVLKIVCSLIGIGTAEYVRVNY